MHPDRLAADDCSLIVIDVQDKLLPAIDSSQALLTNISFLLESAKFVDVPIHVTEQYPQGLGPTAAELKHLLPAALPGKVMFSSCAVAELMAALRSSGRRWAVLTGMESHVCVMQTALDLLGHDIKVAIAADAISCRGRLNHDLALQRMDRAGALITTCEAIGFEWIRSSGHPRFKEFSKLVQQRTKKIAETPV
jgi:isochorismate hydrolase